MSHIVNRTGEIIKDKYGIDMKIIYYENANNIIVEFQDEYKAKVHAKYLDFKNKKVDNPFRKTIYGIGYLGGKKEKNECYKTWKAMMDRCYNGKYLTYKDCEVCEEWHNFQNFKKWFKENYYTINNETMCLDKDILFKNNKIYSPNTCVFVPKRINNLFVKNDINRGKYPIGVILNKNNNKYMAKCKTNTRTSIHLGTYDTPEQAFDSYKKFKENYIKQVADEYKNIIPKNLYVSMYEWKVNIND